MEKILLSCQRRFGPSLGGPIFEPSVLWRGVGSIQNLIINQKLNNQQKSDRYASNTNGSQ